MSNKYNHSVDAYLRTVAKCEVLDHDTIVRLAREWQDKGSNSALHRLIHAHLRFVVKIAYNYNFGVFPFEDVISAGNEGLVIATKKYEPSRGTKLTTYAAWWIRAYILDMLVRGNRTIKIGSTSMQARLIRNLPALLEYYRTTDMSFEDQVQEIATNFGSRVETVRAIIEVLAGREISIHAPINENGGEFLDIMASGDLLPDEELSSARLAVQLRESLAKKFPTLTSRERYILEHRLMNDDPVSLQEIGERFGITRERVRQLEEKLKEKLRGPLAGFRDVVA